ncbi:MAG: VOC family protein [Gammaproteobacteria bacterium]
MENKIKFAHTNLIAQNWRSLAQFYIDVFDCQPIYPERNLSGEWLHKLTSVNDAKIQGIHLWLPGYENGPTLEIFEYSPLKPTSQQVLNTKGFGHIAFHVDNVEAMIDKVVQHGGSLFGEVQKRQYLELDSLLTVVYIKDPESNFIELQNWSNS